MSLWSLLELKKEDGRKGDEREWKKREKETRNVQRERGWKRKKITRYFKRKQ